MELYACGKNESGNLGLPAVCVRYHILGTNPCPHNNHCRSPEDPTYCPRMVTSLTRVLNARDIRIIFSDSNSTILANHESLYTFGKHGGNGLFGSNTQLSGKASQVSQVCCLGDPRYSIVLTHDGMLWLGTNVSGHEDDFDFKAQISEPGKEILHLAHNSSMVSSITWSNPQAVVTLKPNPLVLVNWFKGQATIANGETLGEKDGFYESFDLPAPITQLAANVNSFTALTNTHEVYTWSSEPPTRKGVDYIKSSQATSVPASKSSQDEEEQEEEGPDMSDLLDDLPATGATPPIEEPTSPTPRFTKLPLPPTTKISAAVFITAAIADSRLYLWYEPSQAGSQDYRPTISSLGLPEAPKLQDISDQDGKPLPILDVSVGKSHILALAADGSLFSVGRGWHGELGIGKRQFELRVEEPEGATYDQEDAVEFADSWQRMETDGLLTEGFEWVGVVAGDETSFALSGRKESATGSDS